MTAVELPETDLARIAKFCSDKVPAHVLKELRVEFETRGRTVTIVETRPPWQGGDAPWTRLKVAQLRYRPESADWTLHWRDRNEKWFTYDDLSVGQPPSCSPRSRKIPPASSGGEPVRRQRVCG